MAGLADFQFTMGPYSMVALGVNSVISAFGAAGVTRRNNAIAQSQANIARLNAQTMELQAQAVLNAANSQIQQETMRAGQTKARQKAALAANGVAIGEGSAAEQTASTDIIKTINTNKLKANATAQAWGYRQKASNYMGQAYMAEAKKKSSSSAFGETLLQGMGRLGFAYLASAEPIAKKTESNASASATTVDAISGATPANRWGIKPISDDYLYKLSF